MSILESIVLGLVQGITEFLPISSSGHLILVREIFGIVVEQSLAFDVFLNTATLLAVIYCFWGDIKSILIDLRTEGFSSRSQKLILALVLGTIPAALVGYFFGNQIEEALRGGQTVAVALIIGSVIMFLADQMETRGGLTPLNGLLVGCFQALALIPGISRSGASISGGLFAGLSREEALRFSFLLLIPVSLGALAKIILDIEYTRVDLFFNQTHILAFVIAFFSGIWTIKFLLKYLSKNSFKVFVIYRLILAGAILFLF